MFGLGFSEWLLIFMVVVIVVKPHDYPNLLRKCGQLYGKLTRMYYAIIDEIQSYTYTKPNQ